MVMDEPESSVNRTVPAEVDAIGSAALASSLNVVFAEEVAVPWTVQVSAAPLALRTLAMAFHGVSYKAIVGVAPELRVNIVCSGESGRYDQRQQKRCQHLYDGRKFSRHLQISLFCIRPCRPS
jgi:hypothetical protein